MNKMKRFKILFNQKISGCIIISWILLIGFTPFNVSAALVTATDVNFGTDSLTRDTVTGLDWLDITYTTGRTYVDIAGKFEVGEEFDGYSYATISQVIALVNDNTDFTPDAAASGTGTTDTSGGDVLSALVGLLGPTFTNATSTRVFGLTALLGTGKSRIIGLINNYSSADRVWNGTEIDQTDSPDQWTGSYLVKASVPEPSLAILLGVSLIGLVGVGAVRKIKQKKVANS